MVRGQYSESSCSGPESFVMGAARGHRGFYVGADGWLRGITYRQVWVPGENKSTCMVVRPRTPLLFGPSASVTDDSYIMGGIKFDAHSAKYELLPQFEADPCEGMDPDCACGFYAYYKRDAPRYGFTGLAKGWGIRADAVIEGYGNVILGSKGFRAEKARLVAICMPSPSEAERDRLERKRELYHIRLMCQAQLAMPTGFSVGGIAGGVLGLGYGIIGWLANNPWYAIPVGLSLAFAGASQAVLHRRAKEDRADVRALLHQVEEDLGMMPPSTKEVAEAIAHNYPGVPIYWSRDAMFQAHPVEDLEYMTDRVTEVPDYGE